MIFLIRMKWSHMKFQWFCHCLKSGGHYIHVVSSDWASNDQETTIVEMLVMPFLRHKLAQQKFQHYLDHIISMTISQTTASWPSFHARKWGYSLLADLLGASLNLSFFLRIFPSISLEHTPTSPNWQQLILKEFLNHLGMPGMGYANQGYVGVLFDSWHWGHCKLLNA